MTCESGQDHRVSRLLRSNRLSGELCMKAETLSRSALNRALLSRQMLLEREDISPLDAVKRLVGLQAQQPQPPFVGLWTRLASFDREALLRLLRDRRLVRVTMMRGTLHLLTTNDYLSLRSTLQPMLTAGMVAILRDRAAGLDVQAIVAAARRSFLERPQVFTDL